METKYVVIAILLIAIAVCILSPFLASDNPDGLEASAERLNPDLLDSDQVIDPIMDDYSLEQFSDNPLVSAGCLLAGLVVAVILAYGVFHTISKKD